MKISWPSIALPIATLFAFRMLGLFMLIPVFTIYAPMLSNASPFLIGIALGSYGLSQGILQLPYGLFSDKFGRKPMITLGFVLLGAGSLIGAMSTSIEGMIIARLLQGSGAIGSVLIALLADLTPDEHRAKSMALLGITIGLSFALAIIISPSLATSYGLSGIFYFTALLSVIGLFFTHTLIPTPKNIPRISTISLTHRLNDNFKDGQLQRLNFSIFFQHILLTSTFFVVPMLLKKYFLSSSYSATEIFYLPLLLIAFVTMGPIIALGEKKLQLKNILRTSVAITLISQGLLAIFYSHWLIFYISIVWYFVAFNLLEAILPAIISKKAPSNTKGTAMGIYSSFQFLGIFIGGSIAGVCYTTTAFKGVFVFNTLISLLWFITVLKLEPDSKKTYNH